MQRERNDGENGEDDARNEKIDGVVDGLAFQLHDERYTSERRLVAVVPVLRIHNRNACINHTDVIIGPILWGHSGRSPLSRVVVVVVVVVVVDIDAQAACDSGGVRQ